MYSCLFLSLFFVLTVGQFPPSLPNLGEGSGGQPAGSPQGLSAARPGQVADSKSCPKRYKFNNDMLEDLTGDEPPLPQVGRLMPMPINELNTKFFVYTSAKLPVNGTLIDYNKDETIKSFPNKCQKLYAVIHGWSHSKDFPQVKNLWSTIIHNENICLIAVDWRNGARLADPKKPYVPQLPNLIPVGRQTALVLYLLVQARKITSEKIHVIGHSMGAQAAHNTGTYFTRLVKKYGRGRVGPKIGRITGLDPAAPVNNKTTFDKIPGACLRKGDAVFVDVIHTSVVNHGGTFTESNQENRNGILAAVGDVDFYPNRGDVSQPDCLTKKGCDATLHYIQMCSHLQSLIMMTDSYNKKIDKSNFASFPCPGDDQDPRKALIACEYKNTKNTKTSGSMGKWAEEAAKKQSGRGIQYLRYAKYPVKEEIITHPKNKPECNGRHSDPPKPNPTQPCHFPPS